MSDEPLGDAPTETVEEGLARLAKLAAVGFEHAIEPETAERGRRVAEVRYRTLIEQIPAVTFSASLAGGRNEIYVSPQIETLLGFTQDEWVSDPVLWYRQTHPDDRDRVSREFAALCLTGKPFREVVRVITRANDMVWVDVEARLVRDEEGELLFLQGVGFDVTDQYRAREAREQLIREQTARAEADRELDRLREIFSGLPAAVALLRGPDHIIEFLNPVAFELTGGNPDVIGMPFRSAFAHLAERASAVFDRVIASGRPFSARELRFGAADESGERFFNLVCQPLHDPRGPLLLAHAVEVTEQVQARRDVEDALRKRDEFLSIASHELKTPVAALQAQAQLIMRRASRGDLEQERVIQNLQMINGQTHRLTRLVSQLLDISRMEAGKLEIDRQPTDLVALAEQVVASVRLANEEFNIDFEGPENLTVEGDPLRLEQVVTNLLDNAVKYSPDYGDIEVMLAGNDLQTAELSIRDHGLGIPPEKRGHIFERFYQAHGSGHRSGLGLGLYICQQIVEMHGGSIGAEFPEDGGTRFVVRLPLAVSG